MSVAICPGSFDPLTLGHLDVIRRASALFNRVIVAVAQNSAKSQLFDAERRADLAREALAESGDQHSIEVTIVPGLLADFCREQGADAIVKGLRGPADLYAEQAMALMNRQLSGVDTVFVLGDPALSHIASSLVKDVARHGGDVTAFVPPAVARALGEAS